VTIFRQRGVNNVEWVWSPNADCAGKCPFSGYFPGNSWVDWVALDGYNYGSVDHAPWYSFNQVFKSSYAKLAALSSKPVMIAETASTGTGGNKAQWIKQAFTTLPRRYPRIRAVVWFDRDQETDWRVNSSPASLAAWKAVVASPLYAGSAATLKAVARATTDVDSRTPGRKRRVAKRPRRHVKK
jgi:mannan endo-1,4-beta-mannosidase